MRFTGKHDNIIVIVKEMAQRMITAVCLNPSVDQVITIPQFTYGGMNRVDGTVEVCAGKAVNAALVASAVGACVRVVGFLCRTGGEGFGARLDGRGVGHRFIPIEGRVRRNIKLLNAAEGVVTEVNEPGAPVTGADTRQLEAALYEGGGPGDWLLFTGSMPPGCERSQYRRWIERARSAGFRCALDAEGEALSQGILARPEVIKPNRFELQKLMGRALASPEEIVRAAREIVLSGVGLVVVSLGREGSVMVDGECAYWAAPMEVPVHSTVGAGDAMLAGLLAGLSKGDEAEAAYRLGVACALASVMGPGSGEICGEEVRRKYKEILLKRVMRI